MHNNEDKSGFLSGGAMGAQFGGPLGFVVGAALGGFLGSKAKKKRKIAEEKILVANTKRATKIGDQVIAGLNQSKAEIAENYTRGLSTERAKYAASGKRLEGASYQRVLGAVGQQRDEALTGVATDTDKFKKSEAFKFIKQDYEYMTQSDNTLSTMQIRTEGRGSAGFYTDDQKKQLRTSVRGSKSERAGYGRIFSEYQQSITPTFEQYESFLFGNEKDKAQYESDLTQQINSANRVFDEKYLNERIKNLTGKGGPSNTAERGRLQNELAALGGTQ